MTQAWIADLLCADDPSMLLRHLQKRLSEEKNVWLIAEETWQTVAFPRLRGRSEGGYFFCAFMSAMQFAAESTGFTRLLLLFQAIWLWTHLPPSQETPSELPLDDSIPDSERVTDPSGKMLEDYLMASYLDRDFKTLESFLPTCFSWQRSRLISLLYRLATERWNPDGLPLVHTQNALNFLKQTKWKSPSDVLQTLLLANMQQPWEASKISEIPLAHFSTWLIRQRDKPVKAGSPDFEKTILSSSPSEIVERMIECLDQNVSIANICDAISLAASTRLLETPSCDTPSAEGLFLPIFARPLQVFIATNTAKYAFFTHPSPETLCGIFHAALSVASTKWISKVAFDPGFIEPPTPAFRDPFIVLDHMSQAIYSSLTGQASNLASLYFSWGYPQTLFIQRMVMRSLACDLDINSHSPYYLLGLTFMRTLVETWRTLRDQPNAEALLKASAKVFANPSIPKSDWLIAQVRSILGS